MAAALLFAGATFFSTLAGGLLALRWQRRIEPLMAIAAGVVLGAAAFELLPEAVDHARSAGISALLPWAALAVGFAGFHFADRRLHAHDHRGPGPMGSLGAAGFVAHSVFDGLAIGVGFRIDSATGVLVALAVLGHDFSDGLRTVTYLMAHHHPRSSQRGWLYAVAAAPLAGALVGSLVPVPDWLFGVSLGLFSGVFVYAAAEYLLPRALRLAVTRSVPLVLAGGALMFAVSRLA